MQLLSYSHNSTDDFPTGFQPEQEEIDDGQELPASLGLTARAATGSGAIDSIESMGAATFEAIEPKVSLGSKLMDATNKGMDRILSVGAGPFPSEDNYSGPDNLCVALNFDERQHQERVTITREQPAFAMPNDYSMLVYEPWLESGKKQMDRAFNGGEFSTVVMNNVFGESDVSTHYQKSMFVNPEGGGYQGNSALGDKLGSLSNAVEFLEDGGNLLLGETLTPGQEGAAWIETDEFADIMEELGLSKYEPTDIEKQNILGPFSKKTSFVVGFVKE